MKKQGKKRTMMLVCFLLCCGYAGFPLLVGAETILEGEEQEYLGVIKKVKGETNSMSFCRGDSEYYVLVTPTRSYALDSLCDPALAADETAFLEMQAQLEDLVGKQVMVVGKFVKGSWSKSEYCPPEQQCEASALTCHWIRVGSVDKYEGVIPQPEIRKDR